MFTKYEADLLCQNITYINTKGRGVRVSHPVYTSSSRLYVKPSKFRGGVKLFVSLQQGRWPLTFPKSTAILILFFVVYSFSTIGSSWWLSWCYRSFGFFRQMASQNHRRIHEILNSQDLVLNNIKFRCKWGSRKIWAVFVHSLRNTDWTPLYRLDSVSEKLDFFNSTINSLVNVHFPVKTTSRHTSDKPWATDHFRYLVSERQRGSFHKEDYVSKVCYPKMENQKI